MAKKKPMIDKQPIIAIVITLRNPGALLRSFIEYHLSIGFDHLFLFFDDPNDPSIETAEQYRSVEVVKNDADLQRKWQGKNIYARLAPFIDSETMARQRLNVEVALDLAREKAVDWLLHIDIDELFYLPASSVKEHFQQLTDNNIGQCLYLNYEAIPESTDIGDPFKEATLFKKHPLALPKGRITGRQWRLINRCQHLMPNRFFFYYIDSKSAVRLIDGVRTRGPHRFFLPGPIRLRERMVRRLSNNLLVKIAMKAVPKIFIYLSQVFYLGRTTTSRDAIILHYPVCGFEQFLAKYILWGQFPDTVWGGKYRYVELIGSSFHLDSRNLISQGDSDKAKEFYERRFVMSDQDEVRRLKEARLICRIKGPALQLAKIETDSGRYRDLRGDG